MVCLLLITFTGMLWVSALISSLQAEAVNS